MWSIDIDFVEVSIFAGQVVAAWVVVVVVAMLVRRLIKSGIRRALGSAPIGNDASRRQQRGDSLAALSSSIVTVVMVLLGLIMTLSLLGVNPAPLVASVGVVGIAVGLGAQKLVQDFLAGVFMLLEDQFGVGDIIDVGDAAGVVEGVTLRTVRLRSLDGTLWHVSNSEIRRVGNKSQNWSRAVVDLSLAYEQDVERAWLVVEECLRELASDSEWAAKLSGTAEVLGVEKFAESSVDLRVLIPTLPANQWSVAREFRRRIKQKFDANSISFPYPQLTLSGVVQTQSESTGPSSRGEA
ncbi:MAG: mechanosensitive ion channel family protein [Ilumatobacteraceae bacterium]|jgi:small-conductance mechanosensitive channel